VAARPTKDWTIYLTNSCWPDTNSTFPELCSWFQAADVSISSSNWVKSPSTKGARMYPMPFWRFNLTGHNRENPRGLRTARMKSSCHVVLGLTMVLTEDPPTPAQPCLFWVPQTEIGLRLAFTRAAICFRSSRNWDWALRGLKFAKAPPKPCLWRLETKSCCSNGNLSTRSQKVPKQSESLEYREWRVSVYFAFS